jgi:hypothetical protein
MMSHGLNSMENKTEQTLQAVGSGDGFGPLRCVVGADAVSVQAGWQRRGMSVRRWTVELECGHSVERPVRYQPSGRRGASILWRPPAMDQALPLPRRIRCPHCMPNV